MINELCVWRREIKIKEMMKCMKMNIKPMACDVERWHRHTHALII